ncbi:unnamed protein product [Closterium sp. Yama58-4]|nr:unnamed protein product [Closterium sp. Yama58-4]
MDPSAGRDRAQESTADSAGPRPQPPAAPRLRVPAHPAASEPVRRLERGFSLPHQGNARPTSPEYSRSPHGGALLVRASLTVVEQMVSTLLRALALLIADLPQVDQAGAHRERDPPRNALPGDLRRRGGGGRLDVAEIRVADPALARATNAFAEVVRQARASGEETHVHIAVTNGPPLDSDPGQAAPLRAPTLREYLPAREGRVQFRQPRPVPPFSSPRFSVGRAPGWPSSFPRDAPTVPPPIRAGRDPTPTLCRILNLVEACEVVANLQLVVCGATRSFPGSYGPGSRGSCVSLAESLESPLAPVSEAPAGVAPLARTFPRHVGDLVGAAQAGTPVETLQASAHLLLSMSACMRSMLEAEGAEPYTM